MMAVSFLNGPSDQLAASNPRFVTIEIEYGEPEAITTTTIAVYQVELGLNHVTRQFAFPSKEPKYGIVTLSSGEVLLMGHETIDVFRYNENRMDLVMSLPAPGFVTSHCVSESWTLLHVDGSGEMYRLVYNPEFSLQHVATIEQTSLSMTLLPGDFLFMACECSDHLFYQIQQDEETDFKLVLLDSLQTMDPC